MRVRVTVGVTISFKLRGKVRDKVRVMVRIEVKVTLTTLTVRVEGGANEQNARGGVKTSTTSLRAKSGP